jgi:hypothetical protein
MTAANALAIPGKATTVGLNQTTSRRWRTPGW